LVEEFNDNILIRAFVGSDSQHHTPDTGRRFRCRHKRMRGTSRSRRGRHADFRVGADAVEGPLSSFDQLISLLAAGLRAVR